MNDARHHLEHFVAAQASVYPQVVQELRAGNKRSHWMWFIFPQLAGLGRSATAQQYAIKSLAEARAYLAHPILGVRLRECVNILLGLEARTAEEIFGYPDVLKLLSSLTLFERAGADQLFTQALEKFYDGARDESTLRLLQHDVTP